MAKVKKKDASSLDEKLKQALVPVYEQPYEVPENWCWTRLEHYIDYATDYVANGSFASLRENVKTYKEKNYALMVKTQDFSNGFTQDLTYTDEKGYSFLAKSELHGGELLLSNIGASIGKVFRVPYLDEKMTLAPNTIMLKTRNDSETEFEFLRYYFMSPIGNFQLKSITTGSATPKFNKTELKKIPIILPPLAEQQRIVKQIENLFVKLDEAKEKAGEIVDKFEATERAILYSAFTGKLTKNWRLKNSISDDTWSEVTLQDVCNMKITDGTHKTPTYCEQKDGGVPFISAKDVTSKKICWDNIKYIVPELHEELYARLAPQRDDVLLAKNGTTGVAAIVEDDRIFDIYVTVAVLRPNKTIINPRYLLNVVNSPVCKTQFDEHLTGIGVPNLHLRDIKDVKIPVSSLDEQDEIIRIVESLISKETKAYELAKITIESIEMMKKTVLAKAFRGELGTNNPDEENAVALLKQILAEDL